MRRGVGDLLELCGLGALVAAAGIAFGPAAGLAAAGIVLVLVGNAGPWR